jgi:hypothetical protein
MAYRLHNYITVRFETLAKRNKQNLARMLYLFAFNQVLIIFLAVVQVRV